MADHAHGTRHALNCPKVPLHENRRTQTDSPTPTLRSHRSEAPSIRTLPSPLPGDHGTNSAGYTSPSPPESSSDCWLAGWYVPGPTPTTSLQPIDCASSVQLGAASVSEIEVLHGLVESDRVVVSDTRDFNDAPDLFGLTLCREEIIEAHGGRLSLANRPDGSNGAVVTLWLPSGAQML
jgi:hypothetical protein